MNLRSVILIQFLFVYICLGQNEQNNLSGLVLSDTVAPEITVTPQRKFHNAVFFVTLSCNERAIVFYSVGSSKKMKPYKKPVSISKEGRSTLYYYAEDDFGNKSALDSTDFVLDMTRPKIQVTPKSGVYTQKQYLKVMTNESSVTSILVTPQDTQGVNLSDSLEIKDLFEGFIMALDSAGNKTVSEKIMIKIEKVNFNLSHSPLGGIYNSPQFLRFKKPGGVDIYYSFDPLAPPEWFKLATDSTELPYGLTLLRYYGKAKSEEISEIQTVRFVLDTIAPKLTLRVKNGPDYDTVFLSTKEKSQIWYSTDGTIPDQKSLLYQNPVILMRKGLLFVRAFAQDEAGNRSSLEEYKQKYDFTAPVINPSMSGGKYTKPFLLHFTSSEPSRIFYTLDGSIPEQKSLLYNAQEGILISREGQTHIRFFGQDEAKNSSTLSEIKVTLDSKPPVVKARIDELVRNGEYSLTLLSNEPATIYYEIGTANPQKSSQVYRGPLTLRTGQSIRYMAVDQSGNSGQVFVIDDLKRPMVRIEPEGAMFNRRLSIKVRSNERGTTFYRILPDTAFLLLTDSLIFDREGAYVAEFFIETPEGLRSNIKQHQYLIDWTAPRVDLTVRKGVKDSVSVFFSCSENSTIYYTLDGSNPYYGSNTRMAANKLFQSKDRISIKRSPANKLAFYAEDAAGNQSPLTIIDVFHPKVIPNVPSGVSRVYDRIVSVSLHTIDQSTIYFSRHGKLPSGDSEIYREPLTLMESDTLIAFAIDASGYKGLPDTFIYLIDLPPSPQALVSKDSIFIGEVLTVDATGTFDKETPFNRLRFRWDYDGDGKFDTDTLKEFRSHFRYPKAGIYTISLEVFDNRNNSAKINRTVVVRERCHESMISVVDHDGHSFCIDRYEWPNIAGKTPLTSVSWVEAKMFCVDAGKRLCTEQEWEAACEGNIEKAYPYGEFYEKDRCPSEGKVIYKSGSFKKCSPSGVQDMVGNVWEWVDDKHGDYRLLKGGSHKFGKDAHCGFKSTGTVATKGNDVGFRCCK